MSNWFGCYKPYPKDLVVPESFTHPAKMPPSLLYRILARLEELGLKRGGKILDPFSGIGGTLLCAGLLGYETYGMELEPKFVDITGGYDCPGFTKKDWLRFWATGRISRLNYKNFHVCPLCPDVKYEKNSYQIPFREAHRYSGNIEKNRHKFKCVPIIKQGDSRKDLLAAFGGDWQRFGVVIDDIREGQIASLPEGDFSAIVTSPAFAQAQTGGGIARKGHQDEKKGKSVGNRTYMPKNQGETPGQMANLKEGDFNAVISSPPYSGTEITRDKRSDAWVKKEEGWKKRKLGYGETEENISNLPEGDFSAVVQKQCEDGWKNENSYWGSCKLIYENCFLLLKPGGLIALVVKSFVRKKKIVDLPSMTWQLLQAVGFEPVERNRAWLVEKRAAATFFDENHTVKKERKSFFRRTYEQKYPGNEIDFEEVLIMRKPK